ncbi:hypothetical protein AMS68_004032 [Peltaster fructicola]|uniref:Short-chain dehydrogenase/reductase 3 n=1 Tax=Peltaster fructicola TaxID=286661 RepID=A0A6H0XV33_9PEZI|nr:hypothetical protein AMS68_004032 [Peltaster fructicola]
MSFHSGILPREGFHADVVGSILKRTILNPILVVPALLAAKYHKDGQELSAKYLGRRGLNTLWFLAVWASLRVINSFLDRRALNNGVKDQYDWEKEVVLITGGSDGIGKHVALMLASRKIKVAVLDVQPLTYQAPPSLTYIKTDITNAESLANARQQITSHFGRAPTIIILNAGVCRGKPILSATAADVSLTFNVNVISNYTMMREFLPQMVKENHGMVVTVASSAAYVTAPKMADYAASKAAALSFHEGLTAELVSVYNAPRVRTAVVLQGYTKTALFQGFGVKEGFVAPPLEVDTVAEGIVRQVLSGESGQVVLPGVYKLMALHWRSMPNWMQHGARVGMNVMKNWNGRQVEGLLTEGAGEQGKGVVS